MEATAHAPTALVQPHIVFMTGQGGEIFHRTRDCGHLAPIAPHEVYAVGRASAQAVGRTPCHTCFSG